MRVLLDRFVFVIDRVGCEEDKQKDQRNHHVVVKAATFVGPQNIAANRTPRDA